MGALKAIKVNGGKIIIFDSLDEVSIKFFVCDVVGQVFLNRTELKGSVHKVYSDAFVKELDD